MTVAMQPSFRLFTNRRSFLTRSGQAVLSGTAIALLVGNEALAAGEKKKSATSDASILNTALAAEQEAIAAYQVGASSTATVTIGG